MSPSPIPRDLRLLLTTRTLRSLAFGLVSVTFAVYLPDLGFGPTTNEGFSGRPENPSCFNQRASYSDLQPQLGPQQELCSVALGLVSQIGSLAAVGALLRTSAAAASAVTEAAWRCTLWATLIAAAIWASLSPTDWAAVTCLWRLASEFAPIAEPIETSSFARLESLQQSAGSSTDSPRRTRPCAASRL